jgi:hypothetical protein
MRSRQLATSASAVQSPRRIARAASARPSLNNGFIVEILLGRRDSPAIDGVAFAARADRCDRCRVSRARAPSIPD